MKSWSLRSSTVAAMALLLVIFSAQSLFAQHAAKGNSNPQEEITVGASGQQIAVDKATGKFRAPTAEEVKILTAPLAKNDSVEGLSAKVVGTGTLAVDLQGRFQNYTLATVGPDGKLRQSCVTNANDAKEFLESTASTADTQTPKASDPKTWEEK